MKNIFLIFFLGLFAVGCEASLTAPPLGPDDYDGFDWKCPSEPNYRFNTEGDCEIDFECPEQCYQCEDNFDC